MHGAGRAAASIALYQCLWYTRSILTAVERYSMLRENRMADKDELICVRTCQGMDLAQIYRSKLEAMDIPVLLKYESAGLVFGITVDGLGRVRVMVPQPYAEEAEALLTDLSDEDLASDLLE
jgi:hypothetical protein